MYLDLLAVVTAYVIGSQGLLSSDEPEIEIPDREVSSDGGLRQKQLKLVLAEMEKCEEAREVGLLAESAVELVNLYEKQSRSIQLDISDAGDASKAEQCKALDAAGLLLRNLN